MEALLQTPSHWWRGCSFGGGFATNTQLFVEGMLFGVPIRGTVLVNGGHVGGGDSFVCVCMVILYHSLTLGGCGAVLRPYQW